MTAETQTLLWAVAFFFASAAASAGYLTVSEIFPLEMRALAIALFYALGTAVGGRVAGAVRPTGRNGRAASLVLRLLLAGGLLMILAAAVAWWLGVDTERKSLEDVATPLTAEHPGTAAAAG